MARLKTGIEGLDKVLAGGGMPEHANIVVAGGPGCGKTLFCFEFLYRGAQEGENGLYVSLQESPETLVDNVLGAFPAWEDLGGLIAEKKLFVVNPEKVDILSIADMIQKYAAKHGVKRVVIDSTTVLRMSFKERSEYRLTMQEFLHLLGNLDCTVVFTLELPTAERAGVRFGPDQFLADGIIHLYNLERGEKRVRALEVLKMRGVAHQTDLVPFRITPAGVRVFVGEKVF